VKFADATAGSKGVGIAQQLKDVKDADAAAQRSKENGANSGAGSDAQRISDISSADVDRWLPDHWLRSQFFDEVVHGVDDFQERSALMRKYLDEEKVVTHNASVSFKFGFSKAVRMKMEKDALDLQRIADQEAIKEAQRNRLDTTTVRHILCMHTTVMCIRNTAFLSPEPLSSNPQVFDVRHGIFCGGLPVNERDVMRKLAVVASNWHQRLIFKPIGSTPSACARRWVVRVSYWIVHMSYWIVHMSYWIVHMSYWIVHMSY